MQKSLLLMFGGDRASKALPAEQRRAAELTEREHIREIRPIAPADRPDKTNRIYLDLTTSDALPGKVTVGQRITEADAYRIHG